MTDAGFSSAQRLCVEDPQPSCAPGWMGAREATPSGLQRPAISKSVLLAGERPGGVGASGAGSAATPRYSAPRPPRPARTPGHSQSSHQVALGPHAGCTVAWPTVAVSAKGASLHPAQLDPQELREPCVRHGERARQHRGRGLHTNPVDARTQSSWPGGLGGTLCTAPPHVIPTARIPGPTSEVGFLWGCLSWRTKGGEQWPRCPEPGARWG